LRRQSSCLLDTHDGAGHLPHENHNDFRRSFYNHSLDRGESHDGYKPYFRYDNRISWQWESFVCTPGYTSRSVQPNIGQDTAPENGVHWLGTWGITALHDHSYTACVVYEE
jgi:hypothetical protein